MSQTESAAGVAERFGKQTMPAGRANTESVDNYLKAILSLGGTGTEVRRVTSTSLAGRLGVAPASVTNMLQKLASSATPLVEYERHRGVLLSAAGRRRALEVLRHHRLIETFLYEVLDYPLEEVHEEAERLEHFISERFEERIAAKLGYPSTDPHGHVIPTLDGEMAARESILLSDVVQDGNFVIESVSDRDAARLRLIEACGMTPGKRLKVRKTASTEGYSVSVGRSSKAFKVPGHSPAMSGSCVSRGQPGRKQEVGKDAMKILVIGGGGREHALVWALRGAGDVVCAPGNGGIAAIARCEPVDVADVASMTALVEREQPGLVVVGPEVPLAAGVVDAFVERGVRVFGPTRAAAQLESSKGFAKDFMRRWEIPTAAYAVCRSPSEVQSALGGFAAEVVVKADGLAAGKGVVMCASHEEAVLAAGEMFGGALLGVAVESVVVEEMLTGPELSFFSVCDGVTAKTLAFAQDHKRVGEGDTGPNTGGMGAYSTDDLVTAEMAEWLRANVAQRVVDGMAQDGMPFRGVLFTGLMMTSDGPKVLEFNTRFGDPETEAIVQRLETPLFHILEAATESRIRDVEIRLKPGASACVVAASGGYPGKYDSGKPIRGLESVPSGVEVFHAGTAMQGDELVTSGGRVLAVSAVGATLQEALEKIYGALTGIEFEGMQFRRDIGWRARS